MGDSIISQYIFIPSQGSQHAETYSTSDDGGSADQSGSFQTQVIREDRNPGSSAEEDIAHVLDLSKMKAQCLSLIKSPPPVQIQGRMVDINPDFLHQEVYLGLKSRLRIENGSYNIGELREYLRETLAETRRQMGPDAAVTKLILGYHAGFELTENKDKFLNPLKALENSLSDFSLKQVVYSEAGLIYPRFFVYLNKRKFGKTQDLVDQCKDKFKSEAPSAWTAHGMEIEALMHLVTAEQHPQFRKEEEESAMHCYRLAHDHILQHPSNIRNMVDVYVSYYIVHMAVISLHMPVFDLIDVFHDILLKHGRQDWVNAKDLQNALSMLIVAKRYLDEADKQDRFHDEYFILIAQIYYQFRKGQVLERDRRICDAIVATEIADDLYNGWKLDYTDKDLPSRDYICNQMEILLHELRTRLCSVHDRYCDRKEQLANETSSGPVCFEKTDPSDINDVLKDYVGMENITDSDSSLGDLSDSSVLDTSDYRETVDHHKTSLPRQDEKCNTGTRKKKTQRENIDLFTCHCEELRKVLTTSTYVDIDVKHTT